MIGQQPSPWAQINPFNMGGQKQPRPTMGTGPNPINPNPLLPPGQKPPLTEEDQIGDFEGTLRSLAPIGEQDQNAVQNQGIGGMVQNAVKRKVGANDDGNSPINQAARMALFSMI